MRRGGGGDSGVDFALWDSRVVGRNLLELEGSRRSDSRGLSWVQELLDEEGRGLIAAETWWLGMVVETWFCSMPARTACWRMETC